MPKRWKDDQALVDALSENMMTAMSMFPKRMIRIDELVHTYHMPMSHIQILSLVENRNRSIGQLSSQLGIAKPNITPLVDSLHERGYVERVRSDSDRRIVQVHILPDGKACLDEIRQTIARQILDWPDSISRTDAKELSTVLAALSKLMSMMD